MLDCFNKVLDDFSLIFLYPLDRTMKCKILCHGPYKRRLFASSSLCRVREPFFFERIIENLLTEEKYSIRMELPREITQILAA